MQPPSRPTDAPRIRPRVSTRPTISGRVSDKMATIVAACALVVAVAVAWHFLVTLPRVEREELAIRELRSLAAEQRLDGCIADAQAAYDRRWQSTCRKLAEPARCLLPASTADAYSVDRDRQIDDCFRRFSDK